MTVLAPYPPGHSPGQRFRFEQWFDLLPEDAVKVEFRPAFSKQAFQILHDRGRYAAKAIQAWQALSRRVVDTVAASGADVVLIYCGLFPFGPPILERLLEGRVPVVFDFDDAIYLPLTGRHSAPLNRLRQPGKVGEIVAGAARTTVGNRNLAAFARRHSDMVSVIPTTLDVERYAPDKPASRLRRRFRIGWSGSFSTAAHLHTIDGVLRRTLADPRIELAVSGAPDYQLCGISDLVLLPWSLESERKDVASFDVGIMPLPDNEAAEGKCGFKALFYMALGVPCIASPVGVNCEIIEHGVNGLLASTEKDWIEAISLLIDDGRLRRRLSQAARETVVERFSGQQWSREFLRILQGAQAEGSP